MKKSKVSKIKVETNEDIIQVSEIKEVKEIKKLKEVKELVPKMSFYAWFRDKVAEGKLKIWQELEIKVFFKQKGLHEIDEIKRYEEIFKLY